MSAQAVDEVPDVHLSMPTAEVVEIVHRLGGSYRQLDFWVRRGYLRVPQHRPGSGYPRVWEPAEVAIAAAMLRLVAAGFTVASAARIAREGEPTRAARVRLAPGCGLYASGELWAAA